MHCQHTVSKRFRIQQFESSSLLTLFLRAITAGEWGLEFSDQHLPSCNVCLVSDNSCAPCLRDSLRNAESDGETNLPRWPSGGCHFNLPDSGAQTFYSIPSLEWLLARRCSHSQGPPWMSSQPPHLQGSLFSLPMSWGYQKTICCNNRNKHSARYTAVRFIALDSLGDHLNHVSECYNCVKA